MKKRDNYSVLGARYRSMAQIKKLSKQSILHGITIILDKMSKDQLAKLLFTLNKMRLPKIRTKKYGLGLFEQSVLGKALIEKQDRAIKRKALPRMNKNGKPRMPRRTKRKIKFSPKQLAAQRLFAKRARAGTLRKRR